MENQLPEGSLAPGQKDITGQRYGLLIAQYSTGRRGRDKSYLWHLRCDCGGEVDASLHQLTAGYRKSCGCLSTPPKKDWIGERFGRLTVTAYAGKDGGRHHWRCRCDCGGEITVTQSNLKAGHTKSCGCLQAEVYQDNLKLAEGTSVTLLETGLGKLRVNNTSGHTGVYQNKKTGRWIAELRFQGKSHYLGSHFSREEAIKARRQGEELYRDFIRRYYEDQEDAARAEDSSNQAAGEAGQGG